MRMICCSHHDRARVQPIQRLNDSVDDAFEFAQLVPIVTQLCDGIHLIKKKNGVSRRHENQTPNGYFWRCPRAKRR